MAYNHMARYQGFRNRGPQPQPGGLEGLTSGGMGGGGFAGDFAQMLKKRGSGPKPNPQVMANAIRNAQMQDAIQRQTATRDMSNAISAGTMGQAIMQGTMEDAIQRGVMDSASEQIQRQKAAERANLAPIAGRFSETGYRDHVKQSERQAQDAEMSKRLMRGGASIGTGGSSLMYGGMGMGGTRPRGPEDL